MTKQSKPVYLRLLIVFICVSIGKCALSQVSDTIVVYENVYVTDTVWMEEVVLAHDTIQYQTLKQIHPELLPAESATISESSIYKEKNQKQTEMKKAGLIAGFLFTLQTISFGQAEFSLLAGPTIMGIEHHTGTIDHSVWDGAHLGFEFTMPTKGRISFTAGATGRYLQPTKPYQQVRAVDEALSYLEQDWLQTNTDVILNELNNGLFTAPYFQLAIPFKLNWNERRYNYFAGMAYHYTSFIYEIPETFLQSGFSHQPLDTKFNNLVVLLGAKLKLARHLGVSLAMEQDLYGIHNFFNYGVFPNLGVKEYYFKKWNMDFSLVYTF